MRRFFTFLLPLTVLTLSLAACADGKITMSSFDGNSVVSVHVEIADTPQEREQGLMHRAELNSKEGMFFALPEPDVFKMWMRDTLIPLEVLYFDADGNFVNSLTMEPCTEDPCKEYASAALAQYALEVAPGFREAHGIGVGWKLDLASVRKNVSPR